MNSTLSDTTAEFSFFDPGLLVDRELSLELQIATLGDGRDNVPVYHFKMMVGRIEAGRIEFRAQTNRQIELYVGHIGYNVYPAYTGHHYAERACRLLLPLARLHGHQQLWITCNPDNHPSRRTCERLGATLVELIALPEDQTTTWGEFHKCRFQLML